MLEVAAEVVLDDEVALVDRRHPGKLVHVLQDDAVLVVSDRAIGLAVGKPLDVREGPSFRDFLDGEVELVAGHEIHRAPGDETFLRLDGDLRADQADDRVGVDRLDHLGRFHVRFERGSGGVHHHELAVLQLRDDVLELQAMRRCVDQLRALHECGRLREPSRVPEGAHLALHLVARAGATVIAVE